MATIRKGATLGQPVIFWHRELAVSGLATPWQGQGASGYP